MVTKRRHRLREALRTAAGIALLIASLTELLSVLVVYGAGVDGRLHLFFTVISIVGALLIFLNIRYSAYMVLPLALGIFFYEIYQTASSVISLYTVVSGISFLIASLLCFMLIRAHKI